MENQEKRECCFDCEFFEAGNDACGYLGCAIRHPSSFFCSEFTRVFEECEEDQ